MTTFYPSSPDVTEASPIVLAAGGEAAGRDIQLRKTRVYWSRDVSFRLRSPETRERIMLSLQPADPASRDSLGMVRSASIMEADGNFTFKGVKPGR